MTGTQNNTENTVSFVSIGAQVYKKTQVRRALTFLEPSVVAIHMQRTRQWKFVIESYRSDNWW